MIRASGGVRRRFLSAEIRPQTSFEIVHSCRNFDENFSFWAFGTMNFLVRIHPTEGKARQDLSRVIEAHGHRWRLLGPIGMGLIYGLPLASENSIQRPAWHRARDRAALAAMSPELTRHPQTDPTRAYHYRDSLYAADLVAAALVHFDFFTQLAAKPARLEEICACHGWAPRPADVLLTLCTANGFLERDAAEVFSVSAEGRDFLCADSPWNLGPYYNSLKDRPVTLDYVRVLKTGKPANWGGAKESLDWHRAMEQEDFARMFTATMDCRGRLLGPALARALDLSGRRRVLDVAGGSGIYAGALVAANPGLEATVLEQSPVDRIAAARLAELGVADRVQVVAAEMFQDAWPADCDVHLFSNVLHDWEEPEVATLLDRSFQAMPSGGLLVIHDAFINASKTGPLPVAEYSALLMHSTRGKCYSVSEYGSLLAAAGFAPGEYRGTAAQRGFMTARKP